MSKKAKKDVFTTGVVLVDNIIKASEMDASCFSSMMRATITSIADIVSFLLSDANRKDARIRELEEALKKAEEKAHDLEWKLHKNSRNSSHSPSSDGYRKPPAKSAAKKKQKNEAKTEEQVGLPAAPEVVEEEEKKDPPPKPVSLRGKSGLKSGGQEGHEGHGLGKLDADIVKTITHYPAACEACPHFEECKNGGAPCSSEKRNAYEVEIKLIRCEHVAMNFMCPHSNEKMKASFPEGVNSSQQYGDSIKSIVLTDFTNGIKSALRTANFLNTVFGLNISDGTVFNWIDDFSRRCNDDVNPVIRQSFTTAEVANADETGGRAGGRLCWIHVFTTKNATFYGVHNKRGLAAMKDIGILNKFHGYLVHDCLSAYFKLQNIKAHGVCNQHLQRELLGGGDYDPDMKDDLLAIEATLRTLIHLKNELMEAGETSMDKAVREGLEAGLKEQIEKALAKLPPPVRTGKRGRPKRGKIRCLLERMLGHFDEMVLFLRDFDVPATNNASEQKLRIFRCRESISKCFRTFEGLEKYAHMLSALETARQNGFSPMTAIKKILQGNGSSFYRDMLGLTA